ncbi:probable Respiratory supercomplex factor 1, mitochondrial [Melanopsichium pennsylvanicum]|uniref:Respiratory supercomplex factor mitochondrial n=2 Tax=Melanopsichium pennsylvanicum TaxID=63383 RepID=A0A077QWY3_9BASI|nr:rcf1_ustma ame: full=respiratory supercomplex factor mitochondrial [Melanopsichium pennsylvanicum 4]SNX81358.1 probable Respiratory supercomplex factor 1, mitochondrial [Melanopsichium pennsylvanicum]
MSGMPSADLSTEQQQPGGPANGSSPSGDEYVSAFAGEGALGSQMPEAPKDKFFKKMREQPLVPIGSLLTCGALIVASNHLRTGNRDQFNKALRWRVGFQGLTVLAALAGSFYYGQKAAASVPAPPATPTDAPLQHGTVTTLPGRGPTVWQQQRAEERAAKEKSRFEGRVGQALDREINDDRRLEEALLGKEEDLEQLKKKRRAENRERPIIGQDARRQV